MALKNNPQNPAQVSRELLLCWKDLGALLGHFQDLQHSRAPPGHPSPSDLPRNYPLSASERCFLLSSWPGQAWVCMGSSPRPLGVLNFAGSWGSAGNFGTFQQSWGTAEPV